MNEIILESVKEDLGIPLSVDAFDNSLIRAINSAIMVLTEFGIGERGFSLTTGDEEWTDYLKDIEQLETVRTYIYLRVRLLFDPPTSSFVLQAVKDQISELEFRLNVLVDPKE